MGERLGVVEEEAMIAALLDEVGASRGVTDREGVLLRRFLDNGLVLQHRGGGHIVTVRDAVVAIEPVAGREEALPVSQMPLAHTGRTVAGGSQHGGNGHLIRRQPAARPRKEDPPRACQPQANGQPSSHQRPPARCADGRGGVELAQPHALSGHPVEVGCVDRRVAHAREIAVPEIIREDDDDVGRPATLVGARRAPRTRHGQSCPQGGALLQCIPA